MVKSNPNSARITVQMPPEEKEFFEWLADHAGRSTSAEALQRLRRSYDAEWKQHQKNKPKPKK